MMIQKVDRDNSVVLKKNQYVSKLNRILEVLNLKLNFKRFYFKDIKACNHMIYMGNKLLVFQNT